MLIASTGERNPCKLINISDDGYLEIHAIDPVNSDARLQLVIATPRLQAIVHVTSVEAAGDTFYVRAIPEGGVGPLQAKILEQKIRGLIK